MEMANYFLSLFYNLSKDKQKIILRNTFLLKDVSEYTIFIANNSIYFKMYFNFVYYQYVFRLEKVNQNGLSYVTFFHENRICCFWILTHLYQKSSESKYSFDILSKLFLSNSKREANFWFRHLL